VRRVLLNALGFVTLGCGALGLILPVLPTTPFLLVAAACFGAANPKMLRWLLDHKYFGEYVRNYREGGGISTPALVRALVVLWAGLIISAVLVHNPLVWAILAVVGIGVTTHLAWIHHKRVRVAPPPAEIPAADL
jgi:uncharacterized membrane protein YbaN (DUF454 family)